MVRGGDKPGAAPKKTGPSIEKPAAKTAGCEATSTPTAGGISPELQQKCLDIFRDKLGPSSNDSSILQEVKGHLFNRDFATAFGKEEYLRVYASRWSPSRALAYSSIFKEVDSTLKIPQDAEAGEPCRVVCLGGGAGGELVGLGACFSKYFEAGELDRQRTMHVDLVDLADWSAVVHQLHAGLTTPPELSKYASQAKRDANKALDSPTALDVEFHQLDVLSDDPEKQTALDALSAKADLVTFMFTLNELYSSSLPATQALLKRITESMKVGAHLLVVDSPGSYSTVALNGAKKKYPMQWLLDHTLLNTKAENESVQWEKVVEDDSRWFRLSKEMKYPIALEDMRYQMHLYRRA